MLSDRSSPGVSILIIGDDDQTAMVIQIGLRGAGYVVRRAGSASEALASLRTTRADLVLMSLLLPDADGLMLCSTLSARYRLPVIVLSPRRGEVARALALASGALELFTLPVDVDELLAAVQAHRPAITYHRSEATQMSS